MVNVTPSKLGVGGSYQKAVGNVYRAVSFGVCDGPILTAEVKTDNKEAESRECRVSCALHPGRHKSACSGSSPL